MSPGTIVKFVSYAYLRDKPTEWCTRPESFTLVQCYDVAVVLEQTTYRDSQVFQSKVFVSGYGRVGWINDSLLKELTL